MARKLVATQDNTSTSALTEPLSRAVARPIFGENVLAIDYNFADKQILDSDITFSRASGATVTGPDGFIDLSVGNNVPRFDYDKDGNSKGLLVEEARTNLQTQAINLSGNYSIIDSSSWVADSTVSPSGAKDADRLYEAATDTYHRINYVASTSANTLSFYAKKGALRDWVYSYIWTGSAVTETAFFNLATGQVGTTDGVGATGMEDVGNGWYRCWIYRSTAGNALGRIGIANADNDIDHTGDASAYVSLWGIQEEAASFPSSLIPTYGASATRAADIATVSGTSFSRFFKDTAGTIVTDVQLPRGWSSPNYNRLYAFTNDAVGSNRIESWIAGNNYKVYVDVVAPNSEAKKASDTLLTSGEIASIGQAYEANFNKAYQDGVGGDTDTSVALPTGVNRLNIGGLHGALSGTLSGWIRRFRYYNKRKSDTQVQKLTDTSFLLDKYKGAKAAHSLRSLRDGRDSTPVARVRRDYDSYEADYTASQISNGDLEADFQSSKQTTLPLNISCDAVEMVVNGDFSHASNGWTLESNWSIGSGALNRAAAGASFAHVSSMGVVVGKTYDINFDIVNYSTGTNYLSFGGDYLSKTQSANGSYSYRIVAASTQKLQFYAATNAVYSIDNVSVKEVSPLATGFSTRKINSSYTGNAMRCRNQGNVEVEVGFDDNDEISLLSPITNTSQNLLGFSENFGEWTLGSTPERVGGLADPFGGNNAWSLKSTTAAYHNISLSGITITANSTHTFSWYVKKEATRTNFGGVALNLAGGTSKWAHIAVDETNGTATSFETTTNTPHISITEPVTGWYRVAVTLKDTHSNTTAGMYFYSGFSSNGTSLSSVTGSARTIFGAQLEETTWSSTGSDNLIQNGTFDTDISNWAGGDFRWHSDGKLERYQGSSNTNAVQNIAITAGKKYTVEYDVEYISGHTQSNVYINTGGGYITLGSSDTSEHISTEFVAVTTQSAMNFNMYGISDWRGTFDNVVIKEHDVASPSTYTQTPAIADDDSSTTATTLGEFAGNENMVTHSEDITNYWGTQSAHRTANVTFAPDGVSATADLVYPASTGSGRGLVKNLGTTLEAGKEYTLSAYLKKDRFSHAKFQGLLNNVGSSAWFDLENGVVSSVAGGGITQTSISWAGNNWWRCSFTITASGTGAGDYLYIQTADANGTETSTASGSGGMYVWGCQLNSKAVTDLSQLYYQATSGTAKTADISVVNWYCQNGNEDFTQSTAADQPRIVMGSELVTDSGGKASVYFEDGDTLDCDSLAGQNRLDIYAIQDTSDNQYIWPSASDNGGRYGIYARDGNGSTAQPPTYSFGSTSLYTNGAITSYSTLDDVHAALTGNSKLVAIQNADSSTWDTFTLGHYWDGTGSYNYTGKFSEFVVFKNQDSSTKRFAIEQNQMNHFGVTLAQVDFEDGIAAIGKAGSSTIGDAVLTAETADPISGTQSLKIETTSGNNSSYPRFYTTGTGKMTETPSLGHRYRLTFDTKLLSGTAKIRQIGFQDGSYDGSHFLKPSDSDDDIVLSGSQSHSFELTVTDITAITNVVFFALDGQNYQGTFLIDNIKVTKLGVQGFVTKLYDQSNNSNHAEQTTASNQPKLVAGGDVITAGSKPAMEFDGSNDYLPIASKFNDGLNLNALSASVVYKGANTSQQGIGLLLGGSTGSNKRWYQPFIDTTTTKFSYGTNHPAESATSNTNQHLITYVAGSTLSGWRAYLDGTALGSGNTTLIDNSNATDRAGIGAYSQGSLQFAGTIQEVIIWDSDQSANRSGIDTNINTHYSIY